MTDSSDDTPDIQHLTYEGGFDAIVARMDERRDPLEFHDGEALPSLDVDFAPLKTKLIAIPQDLPRAKDRSGHLRKWLELAAEFENQPELLHLHGLLIAHLRKTEQPPHTAALFIRLWAEEHAFLLEHLDPRWLVSALATFADHGATETQRRIGHAMTVLFGMMKLYESERLYSGFRPDQEFKLKRLVASKLPMNMDRFALMGGGLDVNTLAPLWVSAAEDSVLQPLVHTLLNQLNTDPGSIFRRLQTLKGRKERQIKNAELERRERFRRLPGHAERKRAFVAKQSWGVVSTIKAPPEEINTFIEHHARLGAEEIHIFLDAPVPEGCLDHWSRDLVTVTLCDDAYWQANPRTRRDTHPQRQIFNATRTYRGCKLPWLAHVDVDEFMHPLRPIPEILAAQEAEVQALVMPPAEELSTDGSDDLLFRRTYFDAGVEKRKVMALYPTFGNYLKSGFVSHTSGKTLARTGLRDGRLGIHYLSLNGTKLHHTPRCQDLLVLHRHTRSWDDFAAHLDARIATGSYPKPQDGHMSFADLITFLREEEGPGGERLLYDELCVARTDVVAGLEALGLLVRARILAPDAPQSVSDEAPQTSQTKSPT